jgi:hypothetical protein
MIASFDSVWTKWKTIFEHHKKGGLVNPDTGKPHNEGARYTAMKPLVREFFRSLQGLSENDIEKAATHILYKETTPKKMLAPPKDRLHKTKNLRALMLHNEGVGKEQEKEGDHHRGATQAGS